MDNKQLGFTPASSSNQQTSNQPLPSMDTELQYDYMEHRFTPFEREHMKLTQQHYEYLVKIYQAANKVQRFPKVKLRKTPDNTLETMRAVYESSPSQEVKSSGRKRSFEEPSEEDVNETHKFLMDNLVNEPERIGDSDVSGTDKQKVVKLLRLQRSHSKKSIQVYFKIGEIFERVKHDKKKTKELETAMGKQKSLRYKIMALYRLCRDACVLQEVGISLHQFCRRMTIIRRVIRQYPEEWGYKPVHKEEQQM